MDIAVLMGFQTSSALKDDIDAIVFPVKIMGILLAKDRNLMSGENDVSLIVGDFIFMPTAMGGVIL